MCLEKGLVKGMWNKVSSVSMRKTWWNVNGKELDADERETDVDRKSCWWERTGWWMSYHLRQVWTEWSSCWAIPFFLGIQSCFFSVFFLSKLGQAHFYVFVCCLSTLSFLTLSCSPDFFCLLFSVVLWFVLVQLVASTSTACVFLSARHPICFLSLNDSFPPLFTVSLKTKVSFGISSISITD